MTDETHGLTDRTHTRSVSFIVLDYIVADVAHPAVVEPPTTPEPDPRLVVDVYYEVKVRSKKGLVS